MTAKWFAVLLTLGAALACAGVARAEDESSRPAVLTLDCGLPLVQVHLANHTAVGLALPLYLGVDLQAHVRGPFELGLSGGWAFNLGGMLGATGRIASDWDDGSRWAAGVGPMLVDGDFGKAAFVQVDGTFEARSRVGFAFIVGPVIGVAVSRAGVPACGGETCQAYVSPGDRFLVFRLGIGFNL